MNRANLGLVDHSAMDRQLVMTESRRDQPVERQVLESMGFRAAWNVTRVQRQRIGKHHELSLGRPASE